MFMVRLGRRVWCGLHSVEADDREKRVGVSSDRRSPLLRVKVYPLHSSHTCLGGLPHQYSSCTASEIGRMTYVCPYIYSIYLLHILMSPSLSSGDLCCTHQWGRSPKLGQSHYSCHVITYLKMLK